MQLQPPTQFAESLSGLIEHVTFFNEENGFAVLKAKAKGHRDQITVVGSLPADSSSTRTGSMKATSRNFQPRMATQHYLLLQRNLVYTGVTRGKKLVVLIGQGKALAMAVRKNKTEQRFSGLLARLSKLG